MTKPLGATIIAMIVTRATLSEVSQAFLDRNLIRHFFSTPLISSVIRTVFTTIRLPVIQRPRVAGLESEAEYGWLVKVKSVIFFE